MKNIVILGAGFGGIRVAKELARLLQKHGIPLRGSGTALQSSQNDANEWRVILVDRNDYQVYYPKLYDTAIPDSIRTAQELAKSRVYVAEILQGATIEFIQGEVQGIERKTKKIAIRSARQDAGIVHLSYDYLVLALGAWTDYFGIPGLQEYACTLKSLKDAEKIRRKVKEFLRLDFPKLEIVIGGAGPTGVEVAAELAYLFRNVTRDRWSITIVEALPRVLSMFPNGVSQYAHKKLERLGVHLMLNICIKSVRGKTRVEVALAPRPLKPGEAEEQLACEFLPEKKKTISADILLWAGGVRANPLLSACGLPTDRKGRMEVDEHLQVKGMENIFAVGDNAFLVDPQSQQPVPATAQAALLEGRIVAKNIVAKIEGKPPALYPFKKFSAIVPLAGRDAVALVGSVVVRGFSAWLLRQGADCGYFVSAVGWRRAVKRCIL